MAFMGVEHAFLYLGTFVLTAFFCCNMIEIIDKKAERVGKGLPLREEPKKKKECGKKCDNTGCKLFDVCEKRNA